MGAFPLRDPSAFAKEAASTMLRAACGAASACELRNVTALADNPVGRLIEDLMLQGGVDLSHLKWVDFDGVGRTVRNGLNFTERGFGVRAAVMLRSRAHRRFPTQARPDRLGENLCCRGRLLVPHRRNLRCAFGNAPLVAREAMQAAKEAWRNCFLRPELQGIALEIDWWQALGGWRLTANWHR